MKQATNYIMPVEFDIDLDNVEYIEFKFTQVNNSSAKALKSAIWVNGNENSVAKRIEGMSIIQIQWEANETFKFKRDGDFFLDTRIKLKYVDINPPTPIIKLHMAPSLFEEDEVITDD